MPVIEFHDMHSGGFLKTPYHYIYVEAPYSDALEFFRSWVDRDPFNVTCGCCGQDYSISPYEDLQQATAYNRNCKFVKVEGESGVGHWVEEPKKSYNGSTRELHTVEEYLSREKVTYFSTEDVENELAEVVQNA